MSANVRNAVGLAFVSTLSLFAAACDEPAPKCNIARGVFSVKYTLVAGTATGTEDCAGLTGEGVSVDVYYQPTSKKDQQANLDHASAAFQPSTLSGLIGRAGGALPDPISDLDPTNDKPYAFGAFTETYPKDGFCTIPTLSAAHRRLPDISEMYDDMCMYTGPQAAVDITYNWSNVKVYVKPEANGTQFVADVVYSIGPAASPTCSAQYKAVGLFPYVSCGVDSTAAGSPATGDIPDGGIADASPQGMDASADIDAGDSDSDGSVDDVLADGACAPPEEEAPGAAQVPSDTLCSPVADLSMGRQASGIAPEFATQCDPVLLTCVLKADPPSLNP